MKDVISVTSEVLGEAVIDHRTLTEIEDTVLSGLIESKNRLVDIMLSLTGSTSTYNTELETTEEFITVFSLMSDIEKLTSQIRCLTIDIKEVIQ